MSATHPVTVADDPHPTLDVAVVMRRERIRGPASRWQQWRWVLDSVLRDQPHFGRHVRLLASGDDAQRWLHPGFQVQLFRDDLEGYYLNATTSAPCWFVLWRMDEQPTLAEVPIARPVAVSLSYHDAGRWLDAQEQVDQVPAPLEVVGWLGAFIDANYVVEPKRRYRPQSFQPLVDRNGNAASVSTEKPKGRGAGDV
ncbi:DUF3305 domain-containing protein [Variovorax robiniae]|uniref:DUF3305 domain-containing protein n=1 Tax=Variovorax robiniae TaxID=1836199 RepID=A0ABU8XAR2_9BURK